MTRRKNLVLLTVIFCFSVVIYCALVIFNARSITEELIAKAKSQIQTPSSLPSKFMDRFIQYQDPNFFTHGGTDFINGRITSITQALVKILYFDEFKPGFAKIKQSLIARFALNPMLSKDDQLLLFLNLAYLGHVNGEEIRGFSNASQAYFNKDIYDLSDDEFQILLNKLTNPNK